MTGKLHLPVPAMILAGPIYRDQLSFMSILFLSTVLLTGPDWCSHLRYFGAIDGLVANSVSGRNKIRKKLAIKNIPVYHCLTSCCFSGIGKNLKENVVD